MTLRTVTYDTATHKIVPIEPDEKMMLNNSTCLHHEPFDMGCVARSNRMRIYKAMLSAAPDFVSLTPEYSPQASVEPHWQAQTSQHELHAASQDAMSGGRFNSAPSHC